MLRLRHLPLRFRLPLIHGAIHALAGHRSRAWPMADARTPLPGDLVVSGFFEETLGIGRAGRLTADALVQAGFEITRHDLRQTFRHIVDSRAQLPEGGTGVWLIHANAPECLIALLAHAPEQWRDRYRIGYWAWETSKVPRDWLLAAEYLHEIWVPSRYVLNAMSAALARAGRLDLITRVRLMPHPVPVPSQGAPRDLHRARFGLDARLCEVLCLFDTKSSATRKNPWAVLDAWTRAFPWPSLDARLTLKVSDLDGDRATARRLRGLLAERDDIRLVDERLSDEDMSAFTAAFDVLMSLHRAEGFGLTLAEAMAAGVTVIATEGSGNDDFMTRDNSLLVPSRPVRVRDPDGPYCTVSHDEDQTWGEPDVLTAARYLRELAESKVQRERFAVAGPEAIRALSKAWTQEALLDLPFNRYI